ncbi:MAG: thioredoxin [Bacteroidetes bacterium]|nr:MAG: thioredoxin [Bacteroidota bacterium]
MRQNRRTGNSMVSAQELRKLVDSEPAILIYFKNDNCAPCLVLRPKVKELLDEFFPKVEMIVVDSVEQPEFAGEFHVFANPTLLTFFDGKEYIRKSKYVAIPELKSEISRLYEMMFS